MAKRTEVTQAMCDHAKILLAGGAGNTKAAIILGVGESTVYRMKKAGFDAEKYNEAKVQRKPEKPAEEKPEEIPGQIRMELTTSSTAEDLQTKTMRFQAAMVDRLIVELDKFNDTLNMILRAMRKE